MVAIPQTEPDFITAGDFIQWQRNLGEYPASVWTLSYALINATDKITLTATNDSDAHLIEIDSATSAAYTPGIYSWQSYVTNGADRRTIGTGQIEIKADFANASTLDTRSQARRTLDAIEAVIENRASQDQQEYTIGSGAGSRSLKRTPMADLLVLRDKYKAIVLAEEKAEKLAKGMGGNNRILVRL